MYSVHFSLLLIIIPRNFVIFVSDVLSCLISTSMVGFNFARWKIKSCSMSYLYLLLTYLPVAMCQF